MSYHERNPFVSKHAVWASESCLFLIFWCNLDLVVTRVTIQETIVLVPCQFVKHLINEGQRDVILPGGSVQSPVVYAYPPLGHLPSGYQFIILICDYGDATFFRDHLNGAN